VGVDKPRGMCLLFHANKYTKLCILSFCSGMMAASTQET
jgi:hypothetical protein